jgi:hypothetical protein
MLVKLQPKSCNFIGLACESSDSQLKCLKNGENDIQSILEPAFQISSHTTFLILHHSKQYAFQIKCFAC